MLRAVFCGTADFSVPSLRACAAHTDLLAVVTQPDRPGDRGRPAPRPVADAARELGVPLRQPARLRDPGEADAVLALGADVLVVAAYGQIVPAGLLDGHRLGGVNVHPSLLPRWRGAAPVNAALLHGDARTGVCIMRMEATMDTGPVYRRETVAIETGTTAPQLLPRLAELGAALLVQVLDDLEAGTARTEPQAADGVTYVRRFTREDAAVSWRESTAADVDRHVRALQPWPGTVVPLGGQDVRLLAGRVDPDRSGEPGTVLAVEGDEAWVGTREGAYVASAVQPPGRRPMPAAAYLRGRRQGPPA